MLSTKYLELDSAYRNRNLYPEAAQFTVPVSQFGLKSQSQALDPITDAYPTIIFSPADFYIKTKPASYNSYTFTAAETGPIQNPTILSTTSALVYVLTCSFPKMDEDNAPVVVPSSGYFNGAVLVSKDANPNPSSQPTGLRRICDTQLLIKKSTEGTWDCTYKFTIESEFSGELVKSTNDATREFYIPNPTDFTDPTTPYIFIPYSIMAQNYYATPNYIMWNQTRGNYANILSYDGVTHIAKLSDISGLNWDFTDVFIVRTAPPKVFNKFTVAIVPGINNSQITLPIVYPDTIVNETFINSFIRIYANVDGNVITDSPNAYLEGNNVFRIINYNNGIADVLILTNGSGYTSPPEVVFDDTLNNNGGTGASAYAVLTGDQVTSIVLTSGGTGYSGLYPPTVKFIGGGGFGASASANVNNIIFVPNLNIPTIPAFPAGYFFEILPFTRDSYSPFTFGGSMSAQNKAVAQEVALNHITLPNSTLLNGGRIAFYPYIYVVLQNASSSSSDNKFILCSNNPNTYQAIFKIPITDMNQPLISPFVRLTGVGMVQTIKFKQNEDMRVAVLLPNGELFQTASQDTSNGQAPNPLLQISMCFAMTPV